jgi:hypothetical protein
MIDLPVPEQWLIEVIPRDSVSPWYIDCMYWGVTNDAIRLIKTAGGTVIGDGEVTAPHLLKIRFSDDATAAIFKLTHL